MVDSKLVAADVVDGEGWPGKHELCRDDEDSEAIDADAEAAEAMEGAEAAASPATAASTFVKALPEPTDRRRSTRRHARRPTLSRSRRRATPGAPKGDSVAHKTQHSTATSSPPAARGTPHASAQDTVRREYKGRVGNVPADISGEGVSGGID